MAAEYDQYAPSTPHALRAATQAAPGSPPPAVHIIPGADHFYGYPLGASERVAGLITSWIALEHAKTAFCAFIAAPAVFGALAATGPGSGSVRDVGVYYSRAQNRSTAL